MLLSACLSKYVTSDDERATLKAEAPRPPAMGGAATADSSPAATEQRTESATPDATDASGGDGTVAAQSTESMLAAEEADSRKGSRVVQKSANDDTVTDIARNGSRF